MSNPLKYAVLLKDNNGVLIGQIQNKIDSISWEWNRVGGCGGCSIKVKEPWDGALAGSFAEDYEINIFFPEESGTSSLWYSGYIDKVSPIVNQDEFLNVFCLGYVNQLKRASVIDRTYLGSEISDIAKDVIDTDVAPITSVTSAAADYEDTNFSGDKIPFNESAFDVIQKLAQIAGKREWGVRADKSFFFLKRNDDTTRTFNITEDFTSWKPIRDFNPIITRVNLIGGDNYSGRFTVINKIAIRETIVSNSSIVTQSVGQQFARSFLKEKALAKRSYMANIAQRDVRIESILPLGGAEVNVKRGLHIKYDAADSNYDTGDKYDGGTERFQMENIKYVLTDDKINVNINFGPIQPNISEDLVRIENQLTNLREL